MQGSWIASIVLQLHSSKLSSSDSNYSAIIFLNLSAESQKGRANFQKPKETTINILLCHSVEDQCCCQTNDGSRHEGEGEILQGFFVKFRYGNLNECGK